MHHFSPHIQSIAATDRLIATCGIITYAQEVLVPELAVMLIKEDMGADDAVARRILEESTEIGELLNGEDKVDDRRMDSTGG